MESGIDVEYEIELEFRRMGGGKCSVSGLNLYDFRARIIRVKDPGFIQ